MHAKRKWRSLANILLLFRVVCRAEHNFGSASARAVGTREISVVGFVWMAKCHYAHQPQALSLSLSLSRVPSLRLYPNDAIRPYPMNIHIMSQHVQ